METFSAYVQTVTVLNHLDTESDYRLIKATIFLNCD